MSAAPLLYGVEVLALVSGEALVDLGGRHNSRLCDFDHSNGLVVITGEDASSPNLAWLPAFSLEVREQPGGRGLLSAQHGVHKLSAQIGARSSQFEIWKLRFHLPDHGRPRESSATQCA